MALRPAMLAAPSVRTGRPSWGSAFAGRSRVNEPFPVTRAVASLAIDLGTPRGVGCGVVAPTRSPIRMTAAPPLPIPFLQVHPLLAIAASIAGAVAMIAWRLRETRGAVSFWKIVGPPLGMSTGLSMFAAPAARVPWAWGLAAFLVGAAVLAIPVARTSRLVRRGDVVLMERSRAFLWILLALIAVRFALHAWIEHVVSPMQSGGLLFLLAFGMILRWRLQMLVTFRRLQREGVAADASAG